MLKFQRFQTIPLDAVRTEQTHQSTSRSLPKQRFGKHHFSVDPNKILREKSFFRSFPNSDLGNIVFPSIQIRILREKSFFRSFSNGDLGIIVFSSIQIKSLCEMPFFPSFPNGENRSRCVEVSKRCLWGDGQSHACGVMDKVMLCGQALAGVISKILLSCVPDSMV